MAVCDDHKRPVTEAASSKGWKRYSIMRGYARQLFEWIDHRKRDQPQLVPSLGGIVVGRPRSSKTTGQVIFCFYFASAKALQEN